MMGWIDSMNGTLHHGAPSFEDFCILRNGSQDPSHFGFPQLRRLLKRGTVCFCLTVSGMSNGSMIDSSMQSGSKTPSENGPVLDGSPKQKLSVLNHPDGLIQHTMFVASTQPFVAREA